MDESKLNEEKIEYYIKKSLKWLIISLILSIVIFTILVFLSDYHSIIKSIKIFNYKYIAVILIFASMNYFIRFVRWHYFLKTLDITLPIIDSFLIFMTGLSMTVSPGKFGEILKSLLLKKYYNIRISFSAPVVFGERFTDLTGVFLLVLLGIFMLPEGGFIFTVSIILFVLVLVFFNFKSLVLRLIEFLEHLKFNKTLVSKVKDIYLTTYSILKIKPLFLATVLGLLAWSSECFGFLYVCKGFGVNNLEISKLFFIYAFSILAGAISMIPGGLGVTEGSLTKLLMEIVKFPKYIAASVTIIIRVCTLWYAVLIGSIFFIIFLRKQKKEL